MSAQGRRSLPAYPQKHNRMVDLKIVLLAYPDNPVGAAFIRIFRDHHIPIQAVLFETQRTGSRWKRLVTKLHKDGPRATVGRVVQMAVMRVMGKRSADLCRRYGIPVFQVERMNGKRCEIILAGLDPDLLIIVSAPVLREPIFSKARIACLNPHPGWLPKYRGLGANAHALQKGDDPGVTVHFVNSGIDTGPVIVREHIPLRRRDTVAKINDRAMKRGAELLAGIIRDIQMNCLRMEPIDEPRGSLYRDMPYREVRRVNRMIRKRMQ